MRIHSVMTVHILLSQGYEWYSLIIKIYSMGFRVLIWKKNYESKDFIAVRWYTYTPAMVQEKFFFIYIYVKREINLIHPVDNLFLQKLQALIARLDKTKNELNRTKTEFNSIKLHATQNVCQVYYKSCIAIFK